MHRRAGSAPRPLPPAPLAEPWGGGGGGWQVMSCLGDLERGRGDLWQVNLAGHVRGWIWRVSMARHLGGSAQRVYLAGQVGSFIWRVFKAKRKYMLLNKKKKQKSNEMYYGESVDCNIIMQPVIQCYLLSLQVLQNQQIVVLQPWLCGSVNHSANRNKHHDEEALPHFCCSTLLLQSMHRPGYVQGGRKLTMATC